MIFFSAKAPCIIFEAFLRRIEAFPAHEVDISHKTKAKKHKIERNPWREKKKSITLQPQRTAVVAQLVEHWLPKPRVAGSSPVYRSSLVMQRE